MFVSQGADNTGRERLKFGTRHFLCVYAGFQLDRFVLEITGNRLLLRPRVIRGMHQLKALLIEQEKMEREA